MCGVQSCGHVITAPECGEWFNLLSPPLPGPFVLEVLLNSSTHVLGKVLSEDLTRLSGGSPHVDRRMRQWHSFSVPLRGLPVGATLCTAVLRGGGVAEGGEVRQFHLVKAPGGRHNRPHIDHRSERGGERRREREGGGERRREREGGGGGGERGKGRGEEETEERGRGEEEREGRERGEEEREGRGGERRRGKGEGGEREGGGINISYKVAGC